MNKKAKWLLLALIVVAVMVVGYLRDFIAININYHLQYLDTNTERSSAHSFFDFLNQYSYRQVYYSKYALTAVFTVLNYGLGYLFLRILYRNNLLMKIYSGLYATVLVAAAVFFVVGLLLANPENGYRFARILMGFLQSPVPAAVLALGYPLFQQSRQI